MSESVDDEGNMETAVAGGEDLISALPDDVLIYMMSFLLSREAVGTCVLAKHWHTLWKSVPALRVRDPESCVCDPESYDGATGSSTFVDEFLRLRDPPPLNVCDITSTSCNKDVDNDPDWAYEAFKRMEPWLEYVVSCEVKELRVYFPLLFINVKIFSSHLKRLDFYQLRFEGSSLDFSSCQVLEVLKMLLCSIFADISSQSLKYIDTNDCGFDTDTRRYIFAPNLIGFRLVDPRGLTPFIHRMPSLVTASVILGEGSLDFCHCHNHSCDECRGEAGDIDYPIVLNGLSGATNLDLTLYDPTVFIFWKDLKWFPEFSKLKTLFLNEWCLVDDFKGLIYFLQHSPILEKLTIELHHEEELVIETDESYYKPREHLLLSKHLKVVTILCQTREDGEVPHILKIAHGVPSEQIVIQSIDERRLASNGTCLCCLTARCDFEL